MIRIEAALRRQIGQKAQVGETLLDIGFERGVRVLGRCVADDERFEPQPVTEHVPVYAARVRVAARHADFILAAVGDIFRRISHFYLDAALRGVPDQLTLVTIDLNFFSRICHGIPHSYK
ncbi:hypothetical protein SDC9_138087 [bioreactor metagenome]|uniref:Uncharacterized protein n=1 Tax=bioreactor metagenome TaxID=1076179 RepID=A0A645DNC3_9ZZZZ